MRIAAMPPCLPLPRKIPSEQVGSSYFPGNPPRGNIQGVQLLLRNDRASPRQMPRVCCKLPSKNAIGLNGVAVISLSGDVALQNIPDDESWNIHCFFKSPEHPPI